MSKPFLKDPIFWQKLAWGVLVALLAGLGTLIFVVLMNLGLGLVWEWLDLSEMETFSGEWRIVAIMTAAGLIIWCFVWAQAGGWDGITQRLNEHRGGLAAELLQIRHDNVEHEDVSGASPEAIQRRLLTGGTFDAETGVITRRTPGWLVALAFTIVGVAYSVVNHTQAMRMFAAKSEWDMKMSVCVASAAMLVMSFFNLSMGVIGRSLFPDFDVLPHGTVDSIYPHLVNQLTVTGLKGVVVAGVLAASFSTFDSIGSTLSALLTRDVYARQNKTQEVQCVGIRL